MAGNSVDSGDASNVFELKTESGLVNSISISPSGSLEKNVGDTFTITATVGPENAINKNVNWSTSDSNIASLSAITTASGTSLTVTCKAKGTVTITVTTADGSGMSTSITLNVKTIYGDYVNYPVDLGIANNPEHTLIDGTVPKTDWRIFYKDSTYTYLIAADYIPTSKFPPNVFTVNNGKYSGWWSSVPEVTTPTDVYKERFLWTCLNSMNKTNENYKCVTYLLNTSLWSIFVDSTYADACIGGPTIEMLCKSWTAEYPAHPIYFGINSSGYTVGGTKNPVTTSWGLNTDDEFCNTLYFPHNKHGNNIGWNDTHGYWMASPATDNKYKYIFTMYETLILGHAHTDANWNAIRPVVCLKSTVNLILNDNGIWQLSN